MLKHLVLAFLKIHFAARAAAFIVNGRAASARPANPSHLKVKAQMSDWLIWVLCVDLSVLKRFVGQS
jgi:hypothetical protein